MRKSDAERREFLRTLKPRLLQIAESAAEASGSVEFEALQENIAAARREVREKAPGIRQ